MLLVEGSGNGIRQVLAGLPGWVADEEAVVPVPTTAGAGAALVVLAAAGSSRQPGRRSGA